MLKLTRLRVVWLASLCLVGTLSYAVSGWAVGTPSVMGPVTGELLRGRTVVLDPGHGGRDSGALGHASREADLNLAVALAFRAWLERAGARVLMTWSNPAQLPRDHNFRVHDRASWIAHTGADVLVDIHCNSGMAARGPQVFYWDGTPSRLLADRMSDELHDFTHTRREVQRINQYVLRYAGMPAINVEVGFINNRVEERRLMQPGYRRALTWYMLIGLERWFLRARWPATLDDAPPPATLLVR